jgi:hypothetical protein
MTACSGGGLLPLNNLPLAISMASQYFLLNAYSVAVMLTLWHRKSS